MGQVLSQPIQSQLLQRRGNKNYKCGSSEMHGFRMSMEDAHTIAPCLSEKFPDVGLFGVFDGHAGDRAAKFLAAELHKRVAALEDPTNEKQLSECVQKLDADFLTDTEAREDGSTCTFCVVYPAKDKKSFHVLACNVGDSRSIVIRENGQCVGLTHDHKPEDEDEDARIRAAGGSVSMNRVDGQLAMSRAIGDWHYKNNSMLPPDKQKVIAVPEIKTCEVRPGDHLLICCDGIVEQMTSEDAAKSCFDTLTKQREEKKEEDHAMVCWELNKYSLQRGSKDNHSAMLISFEDGTAYAGEDEFIAGPYHPFKKDRTFSEAYLADAKKHGYEGEALFEMARKTEAGMPELVGMEERAEAAGAGQMLGLNAIQQLISQPGDVTEKLQMLSSILSGGVGEPEEDGEGEDEAPAQE